jgi:hypothetical protein
MGAQRDRRSYRMKYIDESVPNIPIVADSIVTQYFLVILVLSGDYLITQLITAGLSINESLSIDILSGPLRQREIVCAFLSFCHSGHDRPLVLLFLL